MNNDLNLQKLKNLLVDIAQKNEDLNKDNTDLNLKIDSLIKLLKAKDNQLKYSQSFKEKYKQIFLRKVISQNHFLLLAKLRQCLTKMRLKKNKKISLKRDNPVSLTFKKNKTPKKREIGVGDFNLKIDFDFYVEKIKDITLLSKTIDHAEENNQTQRSILDWYVFKNDHFFFLPPKKEIPTLEIAKENKFEFQPAIIDSPEIPQTLKEEQPKESPILLLEPQSNFSFYITNNINQVYHKKIPSPMEFKKLLVTESVNLNYFSTIKKEKIDNEIIPEKPKPILQPQKILNIIFQSIPKKVDLSLHNHSFSYKTKQKKLILALQKSENLIYKGVIKSEPEEKLEPSAQANEKELMEARMASLLSFSITISSLLNSSIAAAKYQFLSTLQKSSVKSKLIKTYNMCKQIVINTKLSTAFRSQRKKALHYSFHRYQNALFDDMIREKNEMIVELTKTTQNYESQMEEFQTTFTEYDKVKKAQWTQAEKKLQQQIEKQNKELNDKQLQYEKLKQMSNETATELITTSNQLTQTQLELKQAGSDIKKLNQLNEKLNDEITSKEEAITLLKSQIARIKTDIEQNRQKHAKELTKQKEQNEESESQVEQLTNQLSKLQREHNKIKSQAEDLLKCNDQLSNLIRNSKNYEVENANLASQNEELREINEDIRKKYQSLKKEYDELKELSEESKSDMMKALNEMEAYSEMLKNLEEKVKEAESAKEQAENERDNAINDVKMIRQRYISMLGENKNK